MTSSRAKKLFAFAWRLVATRFLVDAFRLFWLVKHKGLWIRRAFVFLWSFGPRRTVNQFVEWVIRRTSHGEIEVHLPLPRAASAAPDSSVDVVIPVFNAYQLFRKCIESVIKHNTRGDVRIVVVDDCSNEPALLKYLEHLECGGKVYVLRNPVNLGFVKSANLGMRQSRGDVLLLNSDTEVTKGWIEKIQQAAYSSRDIATVSPFSNNATICSIPRCCEVNSLPAGFTVDSFGELVEKISLRIYPKVPTTVGFCMYIKRRALDEVGYFNEEVFGEGYGEENDLCMRLSERGYTHAIDDATFIYHFGAGSFGEDTQKELFSTAQERICRLHPFYPEAVWRYLANNPLAGYYKYLEAILKVTAVDRPAVLLVLHKPLDTIGGVEMQSRDIIANLHRFWFLVMEPLAGGVGVSIFSGGKCMCRLTFGLKGTRQREMHEAIFRHVLLAFKIQLVHFQHLLNHPLSLPTIARSLGVRTVLTLHDFYLFCESYNLLSYRDEFCRYERETVVCGQCLHKKGILSREDPDYQKRRRESIAKMMSEDIDVVVTPSEFTKDKFLELFPEVGREKYRVIENGA